MNPDPSIQREQDLAFAVLQTVGSLVVVLDRAGLILRYNRACERVTGYFFSDVWRRSFLDLLIEPADREATSQALERAWQGEPRPQPQQETRWRTRRGDVRVVEWTCAPLVDASSAVQHVVVTGTDVTERVRAQQALAASKEELRRYSDGLEARVEERTRELSASNAELEAFSYSVSHDLRAPLRSMQGFALALLEDYGPALDETGRDYAGRIIASSQRMEQLIEDLLAYGRLGRGELAVTIVDLEPLVSDVVQQLLPLIVERRATVKVNGHLPRVRGHAATLFSIFENLLTNALKFVASGIAPNVTVSAERRGDRTRVWVTDNGIGISSEHFERIFEVFERLHGGDRYAGTGIGLAIVRRGAQRMGGSAGVESCPGEGSRFWIELCHGEAE